MPECAVLSSSGNYTSFSYNGRTIRFKTSDALERYLEVTLWDHGYLEVKTKYKSGVEEEYIDLIPILRNLYIDADSFLSPIKRVEVSYA